MNWITFIIGLFLILITVGDILITTLHASGAGMITGRLSSLLWRSLKGMTRLDSKTSFLNYSGLIILIATLSVWFILIWTGYSLLFIAHENSVISSSSFLPASLWEKVYYSGYTLSTMGNGDFQASGSKYRILTALTAFSGLTLLTLSITYLLPIVSAVIDKRKMAAFLHHLGDSPTEILLNTWSGKDFKNLEPILEEISTMVLIYSERHLAYPLLHYFHRNKVKFSAPVNLARLDEALTLLCHMFPQEQQPNPLLLRQTRFALSEYLNTLHSAFITSGENAPDPDYSHLRQHFEQADLQAYKEKCDDLRDRRKLLLSMVESDNWSWEKVGN